MEEYYLRYPTTIKALKTIDKAILCESKDGSGGFAVDSKDVKKK